MGNKVNWPEDARSGGVQVNGLGGVIAIGAGDEHSRAVARGTGTSYGHSDDVRASKTVSGRATSCLYDLNRSLPVVLDDGSRKYVWGAGLAYTNSAERSQFRDCLDQAG